MTKFYDIFRKANAERVLDIFTKCHPSYVKHIERYKNLIKELETSEPKSSDYQINITRTDTQEYPFYFVDGTRLSNGDKLKLSCFTCAEWFGMTVSDATVSIYSPDEIVAHCLYDMTMFEDLDWDK